MRRTLAIVLLMALTAACSPTRRPPLAGPAPRPEPEVVAEPESEPVPTHVPESAPEPAPVVAPEPPVNHAIGEHVPPVGKACDIRFVRDRVLRFTAPMHIDVDGSPNAKDLDPDYGQLTTSLQLPDAEGVRRHLDAERIPYIVLPMGFYRQFDIGLGDVAAVTWRGRTAYAIFGDVGPAEKLGEGSKKLAELLGHAPWARWSNGETFSTHGAIDAAEVQYEVFPGSRPSGMTVENAAAEAERVGRVLRASPLR